MDNGAPLVRDRGHRVQTTHTPWLPLLTLRQYHQQMWR